jgi:hypothetical protein
VSSIEELLRQAENGDMRPQVNPQAIIGMVDTVVDRQVRSAVVQALLPRFTALARPIGDASRDAGLELRLQDAGPFFYLVESLQRLGCAELQDTLLILLDEFAQLEPRSYDELYLWSIVHLSRTDPRHVETFWPMVFALDQRHRAAAWKRPAGVPIVEQPYRLTELLFYYYVLYTLHRRQESGLSDAAREFLERYSSYRRPDGILSIQSLAACVARIEERLSPSQHELVTRTLRELYESERRPEFSDACGLLRKPRG